MTPSFLTFAGGEMYIGVLNPKVAISISLSVPTGILLLLKLTFSISTTLKPVSYTHLTLPTNREV